MDSVPIFSLSEKDVYEYLCELRRERAPSFLEAVAFSKGLLAADVDEVLGSARVAGASKSTSEMGTRKKAPLSLAQLAFLEHVTCSHTGQEAIFAVMCALWYTVALGGRIRSIA